MRFVSLVLAFSLGLVIACGGDSAEPSQEHLHLTEPDNGKTFDIEKGGEVMVVLMSNPSTGFSWSVVEPAPEQLQMAGDPVYLPPVSASPVVGAPGQQQFTFKASKAGTAQLKLAYSRAFEPGVPAAQTFSVTIIVR
jgi:inhibitor of cysteine peptidase